jgi:hypothetical protein
MWKELYTDVISFRWSVLGRYNLYPLPTMSTLYVPLFGKHPFPPRVLLGICSIGEGTRASTVVGLLKAIWQASLPALLLPLIPSTSPFHGFCSESQLLPRVVALPPVAGGSPYYV